METLKEPASRRLEAKRPEDVMLEHKCPKCGKSSLYVAWCYWRWLGFMSREKREKLDKTWRTFGIPTEDWRFESLPM